MPLTPGSSPETISESIKETLESPTFGPGKPRKKRQQMAVAAAHRVARKSKKTGLSSTALRRKAYRK